MKNIKNKNKKGFTLIELLMVISIITLLSSMLFSYVGSARAKSRDTVRLSDMKQINTATNLFYEDKGILPSSIGEMVPNYLSTEPKDPKTGASYSFIRSSSGKTVVTSTNYESDGEILAIAVGDTSVEALCAQELATSTGCLGNTISGHIVGITSGRRSGGGGGGETVTCESFTYSGWSGCVDGIQSRTYTGIPTGCTGGSPDFSHSCDGSLQWSSDLGNSMNWYSAADFCADPANNYSRLPTKEELTIAMTDQFVNGGNNPGGFVYETPLWSIYWSSSNASDSVAYIINCGGFIPRCLFGVNNKDESNYINTRCVR
jgi:prepilin-type N-terminal cleavage/methylation domain-containing protein